MLTCHKTLEKSRRVVTIRPISDFSVETSEFLYYLCIDGRLFCNAHRSWIKYHVLWLLQKQLLL